MMNVLSRPNKPAILGFMVSPLGDYIRMRRVELGLSQADLGDATGIAKSHLSQIETGKITFPNADIRRRLAKALGVTHLDMIVAAGEITEAEIRGAGVPDVPKLDPRRQRIVEKLAALPPLDAYLTALEDVLDAFVKHGVQPREFVEQKPDERDDTRIGV